MPLLSALVSEPRPFPETPRPAFAPSPRPRVSSPLHERPHPLHTALRFLATRSLTMGTPSRLALERLEDRLTPATYGSPWPDATHLTLSFAPDGTAAGGGTSVLFHTLNARAATAVWQREVLRAFQTWAVN